MTWTPEKVAEIVKSNKIVIFAKGSKTAPMCGFSNRAIQVVGSYQKPFEVVNIFDHPSIRPALVQYSTWPTTPQVFIDGEFVGGSDIVYELHEKGDLATKIEAAYPVEA